MYTKSRRWIVATIALLLAGIGLVVALVLSSNGPEGDEPTPAPPEEGFATIPRIDVHTHLSPSKVRQITEIMDENNISIALNASGGTPGGGGLEESMALAERTGRRILPYCNVFFRGMEDPRYGPAIAAMLRQCKEAGAIGVKIFKALGLGIVLSDGRLLEVDDPRLDSLFETAGELDLPVLIHTGDPQAFFRPPTEDNERYAELQAHPSWSFHGNRPDGPPWPSWEDVFAQYERRVARHPGTTFVGAHFGNAPEEPERVGRMLDRYDNLVVETGARIPEIGRHPAAQMRQFFERYQDRILFGTDLAVTEGGLTLGSRGEDPDPPEAVAGFFAAHYRYFETGGRGMAHPTPIQGDWTIDGIELPRPVLEKLYYRNAMRVFGLPDPNDR